MCALRYEHTFYWPGYVRCNSFYLRYGAIFVVFSLNGEHRTGDAGKIFFGRANTVSNPGTIMVDPASQDLFWLAIDSQLSEENLPYLDGLVFGEETMSTKPDALWPAGWRLFCLDAGLDPARVKGEKENLSVYESRAWRHWALQRVVDGFNEIYDYVKLKYGKLRPGIQVATFLPEEGGANPGDLRWKFDVAGVYDYKGCNRMAAYNMVRRYKTLWPDRPIIWLSLGIGGYEMNPVKRTQRVPEGPLFSRGHRAWADSVTAYLAGADTGWFSVWIFVDKNFRGGMADLSGVQILAEDIFKDSPLLERGIAYSFRGAEEDYRLAKNPPKLDEVKLDVAEQEDDDMPLETDEEAAAKAEIPKLVDADKERFRTGFGFYGKYVYDCARVFASLPRLNAKPQALVIRPNVSVWTRPRTQNPLIPAAALLNSYDFLSGINKVPDLELSRYRLIVVHDPGLLTDRTIEAITQWLREYPGLLYVHRELFSSNKAEASTARDHDGKLQNDWPWERAITIQRNDQKGKPKAVRFGKNEETITIEQAVIGSTISAAGGTASPLLTAGGKPTLALWRDAASFKGAAIFEGVESASADYLGVLRSILNELHRKYGLGLNLDGPVLHQVYAGESFTAAASTGYYRTVSDRQTYEGIDLLTGAVNPPVGGGRTGTIVARDLTGKYLATTEGLAILCEKPIRKIEKTEGGFLVETEGLMRVAAATGNPTVVRAEGEALPEIEEPIPWVLYGTEEGTATVPVGKSDRSVLYVRCSRPLRITRGR